MCVCLRAPRRLVSLSFIRNGNSIRLAAGAGNFKGPESAAVRGLDAITSRTHPALVEFPYIPYIQR